MIKVAVFNLTTRYLGYDREELTVTDVTDGDDLTMEDFRGIHRALFGVAAKVAYQPQTWYTFELERVEGAEEPTFTCRAVYAYSRGTTQSHA